MGIFLYFLEIILSNHNYVFKRELCFEEDIHETDIEIATYTIIELRHSLCSITH